MKNKTLVFFAVSLLILGGGMIYVPRIFARDTVILNTSLPKVPAEVATYSLSAVPIVDMSRLQSTFGLQGDAVHEDALGGVLHLKDGDRHAYVYDGGGVDFDDISLIDSIKSGNPLAVGTLWERADGILSQLGIQNNQGIVTLRHGRTGGATLEEYNENGVVTTTVATHATLYYDHVINGFPTFGPGAEVTVNFTADGQIAEFSYPLRNLTALRKLPPLEPSQALSLFKSKIAKGEDWNILRNGYAKVSSVRIDTMKFGYFIPDPTTKISELIPVYAFSGVATGIAPSGAEDTFAFVWYEPGIIGTHLVQ